MLGKLTVLVCALLVALWTARAIALSVDETFTGIPDSEEKEYLFINEQQEEFWFFLRTTPVGTIMATDFNNPEPRIVSDGFGKCHGDATFTIGTDEATSTLIFDSRNGTAAPVYKQVYKCKDADDVYSPEGTKVNLMKEGRSSTPLTTPECPGFKNMKLIASKVTPYPVSGLYHPAICNYWLVVKGKELLGRPKGYEAKSMPANTGLYARSVDIHPHKSFGWAKDGKRKLKVWDTAFSIWSYYKGQGRPFPTIQIDVETCPTRYLIFFFEINDRCMLSVELFDDHFDVAMNGTQLPQNAQNTSIYRFLGSAHGAIIAFTKRGAVLVRPEPFQFRHLGYCDLGPDYMERDHFELQAFVDKRYELRDCVDPGFKFLDEAPIMRPPKKERRQSTLFNEPKKLRKRKTKRGKMYRFMFHDVNRPTLVASCVVCGTFLILNITANTAYLIYRYYRHHRRLQPIGPNAINH